MDLNRKITRIFTYVLGPISTMCPLAQLTSSDREQLQRILVLLQIDHLKHAIVFEVLSPSLSTPPILSSGHCETKKINPNAIYMMNLLALLMVVIIQGLSLCWYSNIMVPIQNFLVLKWF